eukprot:COSAG05_NODE_1740_length_4161_cov_2.141064_2_plen_119_part_00
MIGSVVHTLVFTIVVLSFKSCQASPELWLQHLGWFMWGLNVVHTILLARGEYTEMRGGSGNLRESIASHYADPYNWIDTAMLVLVTVSLTTVLLPDVNIYAVVKSLALFSSWLRIMLW